MMGLLQSSSRRNNDFSEISYNRGSNANMSNKRKTFKGARSLRNLRDKISTSLKRSNTAMDLPRPRRKYANETDFAMKALAVHRDPYASDLEIMRTQIESRRYQTNMFEDDLDYDSDESEWDW